MKKKNEKAKTTKIESARNASQKGGNKGSNSISKRDERNKVREKKVRANDLKTGKLIWLLPSELKTYKRKLSAKKTKQKKEAIKFNSDFFDRRNAKANLLSNIQNVEDFDKVVKFKKGIRYDGKFITKEEQNRLRQFVKELSENNVEFDFEEVLNDFKRVYVKNKKDAEEVFLKIKSETAKQVFYWNALNLEKFEKFGKHEIRVIDFNGKIIYSGNDSIAATNKINYLSQSLKNAEEEMINKDDTINPYFTIDFYEEIENGEIVLTIYDYSNVSYKVPKEVGEKYINKIKKDLI